MTRLTRRHVARLRAAARATGLTEAEAQTAMAAAWLAFSARWPWRWLPSRLRGWAFERCGRGVAARFLAGWKTDG